MNSKPIQIQLIARLMGLAVLVSGATLGIVYQFWELTIVTLLLALLLAGNTVYWFTALYRKVNLFFDAIKYEDGSLQFIENTSDKYLQELHHNLNRVNGIVAQIRAREASNERFFKEFLKRSASGLIAIDEQGFVESINDAALKLIGLSNLTHFHRLQQHQPTLYQVMDQIKAGRSETLKLLVGLELKRIAIKMAQIRFAEKEYRIYSLNDIRQEIESHELETWQKLIHIMTHEIMNSIAPITSLSQTLNGYFSIEGKTTAIKTLSQDDIQNTVLGLNVIEERAQGLLEFVESYRKLSKLPQPIFNTIDINQWLISIQLLFSSEAEANQISFNITNQFTQESFIGDERLLTHVLLNLLNNAVDALDKTQNKSIDIIAETTEIKTLRLRVIDNGKGIQPGQMGQLFLPFYTTKTNGSGIGLSLSRQIMRMHQGSISTQSTSKGKTEFVLEF